jgi:hypothetical protein
MSILDIAQVMLCEYVSFAEEVLRFCVCFAGSASFICLFLTLRSEVVCMYVA